MTRPTRPVGTITRGTTHPNRLRRVDRWIVAEFAPALRRQEAPIVVDLGFGASPVTTIELQQRLQSVAPEVHVVGLEIDPGRVAEARRRHPEGSFELGGFELGRFHGRATLARAFNVLRQYDEAEVCDAWRAMASACRTGGMVIDGTSDEPGRLATWVRLEAARSGATPVSLTISVRLAGLRRPGAVAARLPKVLIHHNVPGTRIHSFLAALDAAWLAAAPLSDLGVRQRWLRTVADVQQQGFRVQGRPARWRLGEITVAWDDVRL